MKLWVAITDNSWFDFLRARVPDEVNFWQPSAGRRAAVLDPGTPFLFKLHAPHHFVVGGGFFVRYSALPAQLAWDAFGANNGVADYAALKARVVQYRTAPVTGDTVIGCNILDQPFFLQRDDWIPVPAGWAPNIVQGKGFDTREAEGAKLWQAVQRKLVPAVANNLEDAARYGEPYLAQARLGQGAFRVLVTEAYARRCAVTGERTLPVLQAAHIRPYAEEGPHRVSNGLLLRSDLHTLFDRGYLTVTDELRVEVSPRIREEFQNGREYYKHHGEKLMHLPQDPLDQPGGEFLRWHNEHKFLGS